MSGLAEKNGYQSFDFAVSPIRANDEVRIRFLYYQPLEIDTGVGRYVYPLEEGGTDEIGASFWQPNSHVERNFSIELKLISAWPVTDVRIPGFESDATIQQIDDKSYEVLVERNTARLDRDFAFYYRLVENLPGSVELMAYRPDEKKPGTFMMIITPGLDLQPLTGGADYTFVLDTSGSMQSKIKTLAHGVSKTLAQLNDADRF